MDGKKATIIECMKFIIWPLTQSKLAITYSYGRHPTRLGGPAGRPEAGGGQLTGVGWGKAMSEKEHGKEFTIVVNGRQKVVAQRELSFSALVALAFDNAPNTGNTIYTITYRRGEGNKPEGTLVEGESVQIKDGMIFNVTATDKS